MRKTWKIAILAGAMLAGAAGTASADPRVRLSVSIGAPVVVAPAPVYYPAPAVVYTTPAPVYYYPPAAYYTPPVRVVFPARHAHWRHHHHRNPHRHWR